MRTYKITFGSDLPREHCDIFVDVEDHHANPLRVALAKLDREEDETFITGIELLGGTDGL